MSRNFFSYAGNFRDMDRIGVDPRTGQFLVNIPIENLIGNNLLGPEFLLKLSYNPLDKRNRGFGIGFSFAGLSQFNRQTGFLELGNGETWQVEPGTTNVRHHPGKDFRFVYTNGEDDKDGYTIFWKDGRIERLKNTAWNSKNFRVRAIISPLGHTLKLDWHWTGWLLQIRDDDKVLCRLSFDNRQILYHIRIWPDTGEEYWISFEFDDGGTRLNSISYNLSPDASSDSTEFWSFEYGSAGDEANLRLTGVIHPAGMSERVEYCPVEKGLGFPEGSNMRPLSVVTRYTRDPGSGQPKTEIDYSYTEQNFLGGPGREFGTWSANEDYIYKALTEYSYGSLEKTGDGEKTITMVRRYNNYHLLVSEVIETKESDAGLSAYRTEFIYPTQPWHYIDHQPAQFQFPVEKKETWNNAKGVIHSQSTQTRFDEYGNIVREVTPVIEGERQGTTTVTTWYPAEGEGKDCPREPNGFVRFMKEQTITPMETDFDAPVMRMHYTYTTLGDSDHVVPAGCSFWSDGILMGKQEFTYHGERGTEHFGRLKKITDTKYDNGEHSAFFISRMEFNSRISDDNKLYQETKKTSHDEIETTTLYSQSVFSGRIFHRTNEQGVVTAYEYDRLGRIVCRTDARGTDYRNELTWSYAFNRENATAGSVVVRTDMADNRVRSCFDGSGQLLFEERADANAPDKWYTVFRKPEPDPEPDPKPDEDARIVSTSDKRIGRPVTIQRIDSKGKEYSRREYRWDGFGRLREETDELGRVTTYTYDAYGRLLSQTLPDGTIIGWSYEQHLTGGQIASVYVKGFDGDGVRKTWVLGYQEFDSLGRLTQRTSCGRTTTYVYEDISQLPSRIITPSRKSVKYKYEPELGDAISGVNAGRISQSFDYDKKTGVVLQASEEPFKQSNEWDSRGRLKTETFSYNKEINLQAHYTWTPNSSLATYTDVTGSEFRLERNSDGQVTRLVHSDLTADFAYDNKGRLNSQTVKDISGAATLATTLAYDDFDRETSRTLADSSGTTVVLTQSWTQNDKLASRVTEKNGVIQCREDYEYDLCDRLVSYRVTGSSLPEDAYGYEIQGQNYQYDALNNLVEVKTVLKDGSEDIATFSYENGKDPTQLTSVMHTHPNYPTSIDLTYDAEGRLIKDEEGRTLTYDSLGRLSHLGISTYHYDGFSRLARQTRGDGAVHDLHYCDDKLVTEVITHTGSDTWKRRFIKFGDSCLGVHNDTGLLLTGCDQNGSLLWSRRSNDASMSILYSYAPYGSRVAYTFLPGFNGERIDPVSHTYHLGNGYRAYSPKLMRFTGPDDFSPFGDGGINPYAYCNGDPVNYIDPTGHMSWQAVLGIVLGSIGLAATIVTAGLAVVAAGGVMAVLGAASASTLVLGGVGVASDVAAIASGALEEADPELSSTLGWVSLGLGVTGMAAGIVRSVSTIRRLRGHSNAMQARLPFESGGSRPRLGGNVRNIDLINDGLFTFTDTYKGRQRLNICAHGNMMGRSSRIVIGKMPAGERWLNADELAGLISKYYDLNAYDNLRMISCFSGNGGIKSFGARLSQATGKPVKSFINTVTTNYDPYKVTKYLKKAIAIGCYKDMQNYIAERFSLYVFKQNPFKFTEKTYYQWSYRPVKYFPS